jgi:L-ribulose-5-phosphate 3-epimerase
MAILNRREFLEAGAVAIAGLTIVKAAQADPTGGVLPAKEFKISLAEWSLHRALFGKQMDNLDFPGAARNDYGIEAVEYVNQFFKDKATDEKYLTELKKRCADHGVTSVLIMCDGEGALGDPDEAKRKTAVENHHRWVDAAKFLGCHSIRVNAHSEGSYEEQLERAADGLARLTEYGAMNKIGVIVENHGGLSSNGQWLGAVMKRVNNPWCGTLPDFGNFGDYDRYKGVAELMPFAKGVSAKSHDFDEQGNETNTDYLKMMKIVLDAGYSGFVGIEYEGSKLSEPDGIRATKKLLDRVREQL